MTVRELGHFSLRSLCLSWYLCSFFIIILLFLKIVCACSVRVIKNVPCLAGYNEKNKRKGELDLSVSYYTNIGPLVALGNST